MLQSLVISVLLIINLVITKVTNNIENNKVSKFLKNFSLIHFLSLWIITLLCNIVNCFYAQCTLWNIVNLVLLIVNEYSLNLNNDFYRPLINLTFIECFVCVAFLKYFNIAWEVRLLIISIAIMFIYFTNHVLYGKLKYKIIAYISINFIFLAILALLNALSYAKLIPFITTMIVIAIEEYRYDENVKYYIILSFLVTFISLNFDINISSFSMLAISVITYMYYIYFKGLTENFYIIPMVAVIPTVYTTDILINTELGFNFNLIVSIILIVLSSAKSVLNEKFSMYTFMSIVYIILSMFAFNMNIQIIAILSMIWAVMHILIKEQNTIFKIIAAASLVILYQNFLIMLGLQNVTVLTVGGYLVCIQYIARRVLKNADKSFEAFEGFGTSVAYLYGMMSQHDLTNTISFMCLLLVITILSYKKKAFLVYSVSLIAMAILYSFILLEIEYAGYTIVKVISYIICIYLISRTFLKKNKYTYKKFEYFLTLIVFTYSFFAYTSELDAKVFVGALLVLSIIGYYGKLGSLFILSVGAIFINVFNLTREFWISVPWWVYAIVVMSGITILSVKNGENEISEWIENLLEEIDA